MSILFIVCVVVFFAFIFFFLLPVDLSMCWLLPKCSSDVDITSNALVDTMVLKATDVGSN